MSSSTSASPFTFGGKYVLEEEIANGGCGTVYLGSHHTSNKPVAIKLEPAYPPPAPPSSSNGDQPPNPDAQNNAHPSPLRTESKIYKTLMGGPGVPWIMYSGKQGDYNVMVIDLLGPSLEDLFKMCNRHFSLKTVLLLADQLLTRIEFLHSRSLVHRDIKPANFVMGASPNPAHPASTSTVNVIDFGLAKKFRDPITGSHIPYRADPHGRHGVGTSLFAAINTHVGVESARRDDLESLAYMLIYFIRGTLPWRKIRYRPPRTPSPPPPVSDPTPPTPASSRPPSCSHTPPSAPAEPSEPVDPVAATWALIHTAKLEHEETLCTGLPAEFQTLYSYARGLAFADLPDYAGLRAMFRSLAARHDIEYDGVFDWSVPGPKGKKHGMGGSHGKGRVCAACEAKRHKGAGVRQWR